MKSKPATMDENQAAAKAVATIAAKHSKPLPPDLEAAWAEWSAGVASVDQRTMTLLRAAFEAGVEAGRTLRL